MKKKTIYLISALIAVITVSLITYRYPWKSEVKAQGFDLDSIKKRGKIIAITDFNSTDYFIYRGEPMGFTYELLKGFADYLGIELEIVTESNLNSALDMLKSGKADIIASGINIGEELTGDVLFTQYIDETYKVLVRRKAGHNPDRKKEKELTASREQLGLGKNAIYVQTGFYDYKMLISLASSLGDSISILDAPYDQEKLIKYVAEGVIDYTICEENVARANISCYHSLDVSTHAGPVRKIAWAVRKHNSDTLLLELNNWLTDYRKSAAYAFLYAEYYRNSRSGIIIRSDYYAPITGRISRYDDLIRKYSKNIDWDWRLLASLICQESRFNPEVESKAGAYGLMQIMPETADNLGIDITLSPENNIRAGIKYLGFLHSIFDDKVQDENERINFILASYNAGPGHVLDAMRLAEKNGMDPGKWVNVQSWLLMKSKPEYYNDAVVKNGYFKGVESVNFVSEVIDRYNHYKNIAGE
ncbi:MAG TPA: transglycosylase SLT domain-containing protein [Bacteroidales bacterium]|nr:transglycosylase SLT domain-containing protein [Bacteroidales bacterium]